MNAQAEAPFTIGKMKVRLRPMSLLRVYIAAAFLMIGRAFLKGLKFQAVA